jgi:cytochrome P450
VSNLVQRQFDIRALQDELAGIERAVVEVGDYVTDLLEQRRREPGDDLASALLAAEAGGERLTHAECVNLVVNVLAGAIDTTQSQLGHALRLFAGHPRAELAEALTFLAPRMPRLSLAGEPRLGGVEGIYGIESLPLRWG